MRARDWTGVESAPAHEPRRTHPPRIANPYTSVRAPARSSGTLSDAMLCVLCAGRPRVLRGEKHVIQEPTSSTRQSERPPATRPRPRTSLSQGARSITKVCGDCSAELQLGRSTDLDAIESDLENGAPTRDPRCLQEAQPMSPSAPNDTPPQQLLAGGTPAPHRTRTDGRGFAGKVWCARLARMPDSEGNHRGVIP